MRIQHKIKRPAAGLSLLELMIGLAIFGIVIGAGVPSYTTWLQNSQIRTAAQSVEDGLNLARAEAVRQNTQVAFTLTGNDWSVDTLNPVQNIQKRPGTEGTPNAVINAPQNAFVFNGYGQLVPPATVTLTITNPKGGACQSASPAGSMRCLNITVSSGGEVRTCDPALPATNPQSCQASS